MIKKIIIPVLALILLAACKNPKKTEASLNNQELPSFNMLNEAGEQVSLESLKGKTIFVNLWATWCPPCVAEMPSIQALYNKSNPENTAFVLLSLDDNFEKAKKWMIAKNLNMPIYTAQGNLPEIFNVPSIPTTFIFDSLGKLTMRTVGMEDYSKPRFEKMMNVEAK